MIKKGNPMEKRRLGQSGVEVSVFGLGTWPMGGAWWGGTDDTESERTIHRALELGVTLFDTAEGYGDGHAEEVLGRALAGRRDQAVIADKVAPDHFQPEQIEAAFEASCRRLQTDHIDIYYLHWPNIDVPIGAAMGTLEKLRTAGRIRAIGVSNFTADEMRAAGEHGRIDVLQPPYNLFWRFIESDQIPYCQEHDIGIMTYSSLAQGLLTGTMKAKTTFTEGDNRPSTVLFQPDIYQRCLEGAEELKPIANRAGVTLSQLALSWLVGRPGVSTALVGARTVAEIEENVEGLPWDVSADDLEAANQAGAAVFASLPRVPDMFQTWTRSDIQKRRYERSGMMPADVPAT